MTVSLLTIDYKKLGNYLREARACNNLNIKELAHLATISVATVLRIEKGDNVVRDTSIRVISKALDLDFWDTIGKCQLDETTKDVYFAPKQATMVILPEYTLEETLVREFFKTIHCIFRNSTFDTHIYRALHYGTPEQRKILGDLFPLHSKINMEYKSFSSPKYFFDKYRYIIRDLELEKRELLDNRPTDNLVKYTSQYE